jgi:hypothetical protein
MAKDKIEIEVIAKGLSKVEADIKDLQKSTKKLKTESGKAFDFLKSGWIKVAAAGAAAMASIKKAFDITKEAARFEQAMQAAEKQFGVSGDKIIKKLKEVSAGTISNADLIQSANKAMALNVTTDLDQMAKLLEVARIRGQAMGLDTSQAFEDIATGIGRASPLILDNLGIITKGWADEAREAGKAFDAQFILNKVLADGAKIIERAGGVTLTSAERLQQFQVAVKNSSLAFGRRLLPAVTFVTDKITKLLKEETSLNIITKELIRNNREYASITKTLAEASKDLTEAERGKLLVRQAELKLKAVQIIDNLNKKYKEQKQAIKELTGQTKWLRGTMKAAADEIEQINNGELERYQGRIDGLKVLTKAFGDAQLELAEKELKLKTAQGQLNESFTVIQEAINQGILTEKDLIALNDQLVKGSFNFKAAKDAETESIKSRTQAQQDEIAALEEHERRKQQIVQASFEAMKQLTSDFFSFAQSMRDHDLDAELKALELEKEEALKTSKNKEATEKEFNRRIAQAKTDAAEKDKKASIVQSIINTALAVTKTLATVPPPVSFVLAGITAALGAAQTALIAAKPIPQFAQGTNFAPGGAALVGERGPELVNLPQGSRVIPNNEVNNVSTNNNNVNINVQTNDPIEFVNTLRREYGVDVFGEA